MTKRIEMPHAAHFIGANRCDFRRATYVNGVIVSTVGGYRDFENKIQPIGAGRKYETMVFRATKSDEGCCPYVVADFRAERELVGYNEAMDAQNGHEAMVVKYEKEKQKHGKQK